MTQKPSTLPVRRSDAVLGPQTTEALVLRKESMALESGRHVTRIMKEIQVPPDMLYSVGKGKGGMLASFYDLCGREMGLKFSEPEILEEDKFYVKVRVRVTYHNTAGREVTDAEDYAIDTRRVYEIMRLQWEPPPIWTETRTGKRFPKPDEQAIEKLQQQGFLLDEVDYDDDGVPLRVRRRLPPEAERELQMKFLEMTRHKLAKAITCAHRRLVQRALGLKAIAYDPDDKQWQEKVRVAIYAFLPESHRQSAAENMQAVNDLYGPEAAEQERAPRPHPDAIEAEFTVAENPEERAARTAQGFDPATTIIDFGKFEGRAWIDAPTSYLIWIRDNAKTQTGRDMAQQAIAARAARKAAQSEQKPARDPAQDEPPEWINSDAPSEYDDDPTAICEDCGTGEILPEKTIRYSRNKFGATLCFKHQTARIQQEQEEEKP